MFVQNYRRLRSQVTEVVVVTVPRMIRRLEMGRTETGTMADQMETEPAGTGRRTALASS